MNKRPKIALELNQTDRILEIIGWILLIGIWILTLANYFGLPETIPIHFNAAGEADGFGNKITILALPILSTLLFVAMTILNKYPHVFNYPTKITQENALSQYTGATRILRYLKLIIVIIFGGIVFMTIQNVNGKADGLGTWFLPLTIIMIFMPIVYLWVAGNKKGKSV